MELALYDTLTRKKRPFKPIDAARVRMYVCGPTVYDFAHIGNARPVIVFDVLFRLLRHLYGPEHVVYVRNVTDVDDKINTRAAERGVSIRGLTEQTYRNFKEDVAALGCLEPTVEPRATEHIDAMKELIERLVKAGCAYVAEEHVLFQVASMKDYGKLSNRSLDEMIAGARVEVAPFKKDPMDFVLWKPSKPGEPAWPSPCGIKTPGRPGWHIECSAMADYWLWEKAKPNLSPSGLAHPHQFDIHGGGIDLVFPHHENEIAQSRCAFHTKVMANFWMHNGFLQVEGEKMSKSLGNFVTIRELLNERRFGDRSWPGSAVRFAMLRTHYRQPTDWTVAALENSYNELQLWANTLASTRAMNYSIGQRAIGNAPKPAQGVIDALADDLNTPQATTALRQLYSDVRGGQKDADVELMESCEFLGLLRADFLFAYNPYHVRSGGKIIAPDLKPKLDEIQVAVLNRNENLKEKLISELRVQGISVSVRDNGAISYEVVGGGVDVDALIAKRAAARVAKNWKESDRIRDELAAMGVVLKDTKDGTTWEIAR